MIHHTIGRDLRGEGLTRPRRNTALDVARCGGESLGLASAQAAAKASSGI
jgi:hypothetical protein